MEEEQKSTNIEKVLEQIKGEFKAYHEYMKTHKFNFDEQDTDGKTLLMHIIENQLPTDFAWFCLEYFADPNIKDNKGNTAMHYAFKTNNRNMIYALLLFGGEIDVVNEEDQSPYDESLLKREEIESAKEELNKVRVPFVQLTGKRREKAREIYKFIEGDLTKGLIDEKLCSFGIWLNNDKPDDAKMDAKLFIDETKLYETIEIKYEEYIVGITKISINHGINKVDEFFKRFEKVKASGKKYEMDF